MGNPKLDRSDGQTVNPRGLDEEKSGMPIFRKNYLDNITILV